MSATPEPTIDPAEIDTDQIERDLRDVEAALAALADGTYWDAADPHTGGTADSYAGGTP